MIGIVPPFSAAEYAREELLVYANLCIYIYIIYIYLHPQSGSLFWPLSEKAPLENQRQILMGRGISLLSTIFTHQITQTSFC